MNRLLSLVLTTLLLCSCSKEEFRTASGITWGTMYHITYQSDKNLEDSILVAMAAIDSTLSMFNSRSEVALINRGEFDGPVSKHFRRVFSLSQDINSRSEGMFDPTVAPLVNLWGFGYKRGVVDRPSSEQLDSALSLVGIADCSIDPQGRLVRKAVGTEFDFSAVAKGYGVDCVADMLARNGCRNFMVEIGGEIAVRGTNPRGELWNIQIDAPVEDSQNISHDALECISVTDCGIATSGNYRNFRETSEGRVGHTINPVTGLPARSDMLSATVIAPTCAEADALATACMAMTSERALKMIAEYPGASAVIVVATSDSTMQVVRVEGSN